MSIPDLRSSGSNIKEDIQMKDDKKIVFELDSVDQRKIGEINDLIDLTFPEYSPTNVFKRIMKYHGSNTPKVKIFYIENSSIPVSFAQVIYRTWENGLIANLDLLGSNSGYRRKGNAEYLLHNCINDLLYESDKRNVDAIGLITFIDPEYRPIVNLHEKCGGQIRKDIICDFGDIIVWYPINMDYKNIATDVLIEQMNEFGIIIRSFK
jgi:hypothetical protein